MLNALAVSAGKHCFTAIFGLFSIFFTQSRLKLQRTGRVITLSLSGNSPETQCSALWNYDGTMVVYDSIYQGCTELRDVAQLG